MALLLLSVSALIGCTFVDPARERRAVTPGIKISFAAALAEQDWRDGAQIAWTGEKAIELAEYSTYDALSANEKDHRTGLSASVEEACGTVGCKPRPEVKGAAIWQIFESVLSAEPGTVIKSAIKIGHLFGIILGLGAATALDLIVLKFLLAGKIKREHVLLVEFMTKIVSAGLFLLWASGISYLLHYGIFDPAKLGNEKVWAKIAIVVVLTINGFFIHRRVLPLIKKQVGRALFDGLPRRECGLMLTFGTISAISWYVPLVLGAMPHFNFVVPASGLLAAYAILLALAVASTQGIIHAIKRNETTPEAQASYDVLMHRVSAIVVRARLDPIRGFNGTFSGNPVHP